MLTRTIQSLLDEVADQASLVYGNRHPLDRAIERVVECYRSLLTFGSARGFSYFSEEIAPAALPTTPTVEGDQYVEVPWPTLLRTIDRVSVRRPGGVWRPLSCTTWQHLQDAFASPWSSTHSEAPSVFAVRSYGAVESSAAAAGVIAVAPLPPAGSLYRLSGLPHLPAAGEVADQDTVLAFPDQNWIDRLVFDAAVRMTVRDRSNKGATKDLSGMKFAAESAIGTALVATINTGSTTMRRSRNYRG
jgi:hypothetical protein